MNRYHLTSLLLAAFAGGILLDHFALPAAQAKASKPAVADTLVAHRIALVDPLGQTAGVFVAETGDSRKPPAIALYDGKGQLVWRTGDGPQLLAVGH